MMRQEEVSNDDFTAGPSLIEQELNSSPLYYYDGFSFLFIFLSTIISWKLKLK